MLVPGLVNALADAYVDAGLEAFFYSYEYYAYFCQLPKPELWTEVEDNPRKGGGGYSGRDDYDDDNQGTTQPKDTIEELKNIIIKSLMHENFIERLDSAELRPKLWLGEIDIDIDFTPIIRVNGRYFQNKDQLVLIWRAFQANKLTIGDIESCMFHECVHAKQDFVDKIELEYTNEGNIAMQDYTIYYTEAMIAAERRRAEYDILNFQNLPPDKEQWNDIHKNAYEMFYRIRMADKEKRYKEHVLFSEPYNKQLVKTEIEAYGLQLKWYGKYMSPKYKEDLEYHLRELEDIYEQIKDQ